MKIEFPEVHETIFAGQVKSVKATLLLKYKALRMLEDKERAYYKR
jgi:hypothetical protein